MSGAFDFDKIINRFGTNSVKWDNAERFLGEKELLPMWVADMDFQSPPEVIEAIKISAEHGIYGYSMAPEACQGAVAGWVKRRFSWEIHNDWVLHSPSCVIALNLCVQRFTHPGDKVIIQTPVYTPFFEAIENNGRTVLENPLIEKDGRFTMDLAGLERQIDSKTKMIFLCNPHNPVGRVWTKDELIKLFEICDRHDILIVSDEIHSDLTLFGKRHIPLASISKSAAKRVITFMSPSKSFNLAGLQSAAIIISDPRLRSEFQRILDNLGILGPNLFAIPAFIAAYTKGDLWIDALNSYLEENALLISDFIKTNMPKVKAIKPEGTYLYWLDFRGYGMSHDELKKVLYKKAKVGLSDGMIYGKSGEGFFRLNFGCPRARLKFALDKIAKAFNQ